MNEQATYVIGHANPDTDSIGSAIAFARLRQLQGDADVVPARQGKPRPETDYALDRFGLDPPLLLRDAYLHVSDVMTTPVACLPATASILDASSLLHYGDIQALPLTNDTGSLAGIVAFGDLGRYIFEGLHPSVVDTIPVELHNIVQALGGTVLHAARQRTLRDKITVGAMSVASIRSRVERDALLVLGDRADAQLAAIEQGIGALIVTGGYPVSPEVIELARQHDVTIISVEHHTFLTVRLLHMSIPVSYVMNREPVTCNPDDRLANAREALTALPSVPVIDDDGRPVGMLTRTDLLKPVRRKLVLVDHNERGQSLPGLEEADVIAIIDHHRIADVVTVNPILFRAEPVGCTCTIIASLYHEAGIPIPPEIAGIMLAAIVNDTVLFRSPTCTPRDREVAAMVAERSGVSPDELAEAMFTRGADLAGKQTRDLIEGDFKEYSFGQRRYGVGTIELTSLAQLDPRLNELRDGMRRLRDQRQHRALLFVAVDVLHSRSRVYLAGRERELAEAFGRPLVDGWCVAIDRVVSRKKDIVPLLGRLDQ